MTDSATPTITKTSGSGLDQNVAGLLAWLFAPISAFIFIVLDKENKFVRFHAFQAIVGSIILWVLVLVLSTIITVITFGFGALCTWVLWLIPTAVQIYGAIKAYQNEMWKMPIIGDWAEKL